MLGFRIFPKMIVKGRGSSKNSGQVKVPLQNEGAKAKAIK